MGSSANGAAQVLKSPRKLISELGEIGYALLESQSPLASSRLGESPTGQTLARVG